MARKTKDPVMVMLSVKIPVPLADRLRDAAKKQGKKIQYYAAEVIQAGLGVTP